MILIMSFFIFVKLNTNKVNKIIRIRYRKIITFHITTDFLIIAKTEFFKKSNTLRYRRTRFMINRSI